MSLMIIKVIRLPLGNTSEIIQIRDLSALKERDHEWESMICPRCGPIPKAGHISQSHQPPNRSSISASWSRSFRED